MAKNIDNRYMKEYKENSHVSLLKLSAGNYFGDENGFYPKIKHYTAKVTSNNCKLFIIPKEVSISANQFNNLENNHECERIEIFVLH